MVNDWIRRHKQSVSLLSVVVVLSISAISAYAATLKDIRVGEFYEASKRVVFEFDYQPVVETVEIVPPGNLRVIFVDAHPGFVRKIPIDNIAKLNNLQISEKNNKLSIDIIFNLSFQRVKSTWFDRPSRLVVDAFIMDSKQNMQAPPTNNTDSLPTDTSDQTMTLVASEKKEKMPEPLDQIAENVQEHGQDTNTSYNDSKLLTKNNQVLVQKNDTKDNQYPFTLQETDVIAREKADEISAIDSPSQEKTPKGLQYYLLIGLVVLTILILVMLIAMMFPKKKWKEEKKPFKIDDLLHRQEEHIATLNSQIEEQLKRYHEV